MWQFTTWVTYLLSACDFNTKGRKMLTAYVLYWQLLGLFRNFSKASISVPHLFLISAQPDRDFVIYSCDCWQDVKEMNKRVTIQIVHTNSISYWSESLFLLFFSIVHVKCIFLSLKTLIHVYMGLNFTLSIDSLVHVDILYRITSL